MSNWAAALTLEPALATLRVGESLRRQLTYLGRNVEDEILGNHVIRNATALILGGEALGEEAYVRHGRRLLARELPEQVLPDGGHYERSPAYHRLVLRDLLSVQSFAAVTPEIERMTAFAVASSRPDGAPALFNDGGLDIAPVLGASTACRGSDGVQETGYAFIRTDRVWLAFDCGAPAPDFLPAHAHADALSFQLWIDGRPVVVDPGTSTYEGPGSRPRARDRRRTRPSRSTATSFASGAHFGPGRLPDGQLLERGPGQTCRRGGTPVR